MNSSKKPLGIRAYGSIPHLPGSRRGEADRGLSPEQSSLLTDEVRDSNDHVVIQEKLDGSNVAVAKLNGEILPLVRAGYRADTSPFDQHHWFASWVLQNRDRFSSLLEEGERCVGEWLALAHGTLYELPHEPFVIFDLISGHDRLVFEKIRARCLEQEFVVPRILSSGPPRSIEWVLDILEPSGHGALGDVEGAVWRMERKGIVEFLGKFVQHSKLDGKYLKGCQGNDKDQFNKLQLEGGQWAVLSKDYFQY